MTPAEFLAAIWPDRGYYALATPFVIPGTETTVYGHKVFDEITEAAAYVERHKANTDIFFCVHSLKEPRVWNDQKPDRKTGKLGAYEVRTQRNMFAAKCLFFDMDVGVPPEKYGSREEALAALIAFCTEARMPRPMVVSSGRGLHIYWRLTKPLDTQDWRPLAAQLKRLAAQHGLKIDPMRTTDTASVLRVAGSYHLKDRENPKLVKVLHPGVETDPVEFGKHLQTACILAGVDMATAPTVLRAPPPAGDDDLGSNTTKVYDAPPVSLKALGKACGQVRAFAKALGNVDEPAWYAMLQLIRHTEDGRGWCHTLSAGHPHYSRDDTDQKLDQLELRGVGPTTCEVLADRCGETICQTCPHLGKIKSPVVVARFKDPAPDPVVPATATAPAQEIPPPPHPFVRLKGGGVAMGQTNREGDEVSVTIYDHDLYPLRRVADLDRALEQQMWRCHLPRGIIRDFTIDASSLYKLDSLAAQLANNGIYVKPSRLREVQEYMSAYIAELQKMQDAANSFNTLGWHNDFSTFVLPGKVLHRDGRVIDSQLTSHAESSAHAVTQSGTLARQVELLKFYGNPQYQPHQFVILGSLAAPLFHMTGHHGVVINATGDPGASKSTSLYTAAAMWAHPSKYPLNGTNHGATQKARAQRMVTMGSLPVCVDEITTMGHRDAQELVMNVTQPEGRLGLTREGKERRPSDGEKSTIMLCTANNSLHTLLSHENSAGTAGSMRVVEIRMHASRVHQKHEADEYLHDLRENYGHIGELFVAHVVTNYDAIAARVRAKVKQIDTEAKIEASERFWSATVAAVLVAGEVASELGLVAFDVPALHRWAIEDQVPSMRGVVAAEYGSSVSTLGDYLESISGHIVTTGRGASGAVYVLRPPTGAMLAHYEFDTKSMIVLKKGFKDYCGRIGADVTKILDELFALDFDATGKPMRIVPIKEAKRVMGHGTEFAKMQSRCFIVDMKHPAIAGVVGLATAGGTAEPTTPTKGSVRAVT